MKNILFASALSLTFLCAQAAVAESDASIQSADSIPSAEQPAVKLSMPIEITGEDLITKVYGVLDPEQAATKEECIEHCKQLISLAPTEDEYGLWLEDSDGYSLNYYGNTPQTTAMANYDGGTLSKYGFFFLFPYQAGERENANKRQAEFCGALLQELKDMGLEIAASPDTPALFDVVAENSGDLVELRLIEECNTAEPTADQLAGTTDALVANPADGRFILLLSVEQGAAAPAVSPSVAEK